MNIDRAPGKSIVARDTDPQARFRLFCFPYAGAGASAFREWDSELFPEIHLCRIQLPGREERLREPPFTQVLDIARALAPHLQPWRDLPFAFFGHSMGALIAFELTRELRRMGATLPQHLFLSGRPAPHLKPRTPELHQLSESEFKRELRNFNGTPEKVLQDNELMQLLLPMLRADFAVCETCVYSPEEPLPVPMTVLGALNDPEASRDELEAWRSHTAAAMTLRMFPGDHFFLHGMRSGVISAIRQALSPYLYGASELLREVRSPAEHEAS